MKDYSMDYFESFTFILNYKIKNNKIIINYGNGRKYSIPYTKENERRVLEKMEKQVLNAEEYRKCEESSIKRNRILNVVAGSIMVFNSYLLLHGLSTHPVIPGLIIGYCALRINDQITDIHITKKGLNDLAKNRLFLDNESAINKMVRKNPKVILSNGKLRKIYAYNIKKDNIFSINDIDKLSIRDIRSLTDKLREQNSSKQLVKVR